MLAGYRYKISIRYADHGDTTIYYSRCPSLNLKGNYWLEEAGFATGTPLTVVVEHGQLIMSPPIAE
ncbi:SymE family type I addiction module toxin [Dickeya zeae]|uniref:SymE family type I addiction module toxin n=1 Tax=Dickeya zeae TaxID=204042 RepID=UPI0020985C8E|nr:SymE family type I addiction module toxin [Dickeya zeae]MCO7263929.1 type I toxin-antitoxin system SymE family toxin [Dickeya zeae]